MPDNAPSFERTAISRVSFGARDTDVAAAQHNGWAARVTDQLNPPRGDDPELAGYLAAQVMHIEYPAMAPSMGMSSGWKAVNEDRPLNYLNAAGTTLWNLALNVGRSVAFSEYTRVVHELVAASWIRNTHSRYQVREFLVDFWHNHFNIGRDKSNFATAMLPLYDRDVIRANALGNFRTMLEAVATSASMLLYLDNADSEATQPNENYARELMELHTMGAGAYRGRVAGSNTQPELGFTDDDVIQASRALSGWTLERGQPGTNSKSASLPNTGNFLYNARQHHPGAGLFLGVNLSRVTGDMAQGRKVLDIVAAHPATADFIVRKLARRIFGDTPPEAVITRAKAAWTKNQTQPDQIARVMESILLDGSEIGAGPTVKVRRPYERMIAMFRTTDSVVLPNPGFMTIFDALNDGLFVWAAPNGRPDTNDFWLTTSTNVGTWNIFNDIRMWSRAYNSTMADQTPAAAQGSTASVVAYWIDRMVGASISQQGTDRTSGSV